MRPFPVPAGFGAFSAREAASGMRREALTSRCQGVVFYANRAGQPLAPARRNAMTVTIRQLHPHFFGEVSGVDLRQPLTPQEAADIEAGMDKYAVLLFRDQDITDEQQMAFARNFGERENSRGGTRHQDGRLPAHFRPERRLQSRQGRQAVAARQPHPSVQSRQLPVAFRQFVPARSRRNSRCCRRAWSTRRAATPNSPTCAPPMTRSTTRPRPRSKT